MNNVGIFEPKPFEEIPDADWLRFFEVNVLSGVRLARHYLPRMRARNWGRIVFVSSESAVQIPAEMIHYGMTKTAQLAVARGLAETTCRHRRHREQRAAGADGVGRRRRRSCARWPRRAASTSRPMEREFFETARPSSLLKRFATAEEVAAMIVYVCSARASATNGAALRVDGGVVRSIL